MWTDITLSPATQASYEDVCRRLSQGRRPFECGHRQACTRKEDKWDTNKQIPTKSTQELDKTAISSQPDKPTAETTETQPKVAADIGALQREVIRVVQGSGGAEVGLGKEVGYAEVCQGAVEPVEDEVLLRVCKKVEKRDSSVVALVAKLLLLPKLYHMDTRLSTPVMDGLTQLMETHTALVVDNALLPLLQQLPALEEHHRDLLAHLLPTCSTHMATRMIRAYAERPHHRETDLPTFHLLCESADTKEPDTHFAAMAVLGQTAPLHQTNVKFGQCLLMVARRFGPHLHDLEGLKFAVNTHTSSLRKVLELQMKKLEKMR